MDNIDIDINPVVREITVDILETVNNINIEVSKAIGVPSGGVTGQVLTKTSNSDYATGWEAPEGTGDMLASVYDPTSITADAFSMDNMVEGATSKILTSTERSEIAANTLKNSYPSADASKLSSIEAGADVNPTAAEIKTEYESNANTNAFTDAEKTNLGNQSGTNTGDQDISGIATNASDITTIQGEQTTQNTAISLNTAKVTYNKTTAINDFGYQEVSSISEFNALITGTTAGEWLITADITLDGNKTLPSDVILSFNNSKIDLNGFTLTGANTVINSGLTQIFNVNSGGFSGTYVCQEVFPQWFGAIGDGTTDDTTYLQAAFDFARDTNSGGNNINLNSKTYNVTNTLEMHLANVYFDGATINYSGTRDRVVLQWGDVNTQVSYKVLDGVNIYSNTLDWSDEDYIGLRIYNARSCAISITRVMRFGIGMQLYSVTNGVVYNTFEIQEILDNKINIDMVCDGIEAATNYINENNFFGGSLNESGDTLALGDCYSIRLRAINSGYVGHNNNKFWGVCFQMGDGLSGDERIPILFDDVGSANFFYTSRYETGRGAFVKLNSASTTITDNYFHVSVLGGNYATATMNEIGDCRMNHIKYKEWKTKTHFRTVDFMQSICVYNGTNSQTTGILHIINSGGTHLDFATGFTTRLRSIEITGSRAVGFFATCAGGEKFVLSQEAENENYGRLMVALFDEDFNRLTDVSPNAPHFYGKEAGVPGVWSASWGGLYTDTANNQSLPFRISTEVRYIQVLVSGSGQLKSLSLARVSEASIPLHVFSGRNHDYTQRLTQGALSTGIVGMFAKGNVLHNAAVSTSTPAYYQCTTAGRLASAWVTATAYDIDSIVETGGNIYVCVTAGTSASAPTGTGTGIADGTVVWDYECPKALFTSNTDLFNLQSDFQTDYVLEAENFKMNVGTETVNIDTYDQDAFWSTRLNTSTSHGTKPENYCIVTNFPGQGSIGHQIASGFGVAGSLWIRRASDNAGAPNGVGWQPWRVMLTPLTNELTKPWTIPSPTSSEDRTIFFTTVAITISKINAGLVGSGGTSVSWTIRHDTRRNDPGTEVVTGGTTTTSGSVGSTVTSFNDATIPANSWIWIETSATGGTLTEFMGTIKYTIDS